MQEENREKNIAEAPSGLTAAPAAQEVVEWYTRPAPAAQEVVSYYVQDTPLPGGITPGKAAKKRRIKPVWVITACAVLVLLTGIAAGVVRLTRTDTPAPPAEADLPSTEDGSPSSITSMFGGDNSAIPTYDPQGTADMVSLSFEPGEPLTAQEIYAKVGPSTVVVIATSGQESFVGTGIILSSDGYVVTNAHVIAQGEACMVATYMGGMYEARLVGADAEEDIAVLKMMDAKDLPAAELGNSDMCLVGDQVYAIGNPLGVELMGTMTEGILSAINRTITSDGRSVNVLQTTAALNNGNSGGPLINDSGQVIGINTLKMSNSGRRRDEATVEGLGFALPMSDACYVINEILSTGSYSGKPTFGITVITEWEDEEKSHVAILEVTPGGPAWSAGVEAGDWLLSVKGEPVTSTDELMAVRRTCHSGDTVAVTLLRNGETIETEITLTPQR